MSIELDLDIATLVGEMEALPCESAGHTINLGHHDDGPASHYARVHCDECGVNVIKSYCATFVQGLKSNHLVECHACGSEYLACQLITILGPVTA